MCNAGKTFRCQAQNSKNMFSRNSSIYILGLLTCAVVIVQAFATSPSASSNLSPWGTRGGAHVASKQRKGGIPSTPSALGMSENDMDSSDSTEGIEMKAEIPSPDIIPLNGVSVNSPLKEAEKTARLVNGEAKKTILSSGGFSGIVPATYVAETNLPTDIGHFRIRAYRIDEAEGAMREPNPLGAGAGLGSEPCVIYCTDKPPFGSKGGERGGAKNVPMRIHDQCFTSEVFRSQR